MTRKKYLLLMAGGSGTRMKSDRPKQFIEICGKAVLQYTMERFVAAVPDLKIVTVLPEDSVGFWKEYCLAHNLVYPQTIVSGGITRFHSVKRGLEKVPDNVSVAVHDGVRPFVSAELVRRLYAETESCDGVIPVIPCVDTVKILKKCPDGSGLVPDGNESADRDRLYFAQTPQIFRSELLRHAYSQPFDTSFTDDASVAAHAGIPLSYYIGERTNIKITTREDLPLARALLSLFPGL